MNIFFFFKQQSVNVCSQAQQVFSSTASVLLHLSLSGVIFMLCYKIHMALLVHLTDLYV